MDEKVLKIVKNKKDMTFRAFATEDISCIVYIFDKNRDGGGTGFNTDDCDHGDALIAIRRIIKQFGIDPEEVVRLLIHGECDIELKYI